MTFEVLAVALKVLVFTSLISAGSLYTDRKLFTTESFATRLRYVARTRWPYAFLVVGVATADLATQLLPKPRGHWSGHASSSFNELAVGVILIATLVLIRRVGFILLLVPVVILGLGLGIRGNWKVAESLWKTSYGDMAVNEAVALKPASFVSGHAHAEAGEGIAWIAGIAFAVLAGVTRKVSARMAVVGGVLAILPPWMFAGVGVWFVMAHAAVDRLRAQFHGTPISIGARSRIEGAGVLASPGDPSAGAESNPS